jgi:cell division protein FtsW
VIKEMKIERLSLFKKDLIKAIDVNKLKDLKNVQEKVKDSQMVKDLMNIQPLKEFDQFRKKNNLRFEGLQKMKLDFFFTTILIVLLCIGALMVFSASSVQALEDYGSIYYFFTKHMINVILGLFAAYMVAKVPYQTLRGLIPMINLVTIILLVLVLIPAFTMTVNGAGRWLAIGGFSFQPSEIAKITVIFTLAHMIDLRRKRKTLNKMEGLLPIACYLVLYVGLIFMEKHLSAVGIILIVSMGLMLIGGLAKKYFTTLSIIVASFAVLGVALEPFRVKRIFGFLHPEQNPLGDGYHVTQGFYALGSGNLFGLGLGMSRQKFGLNS